MLPSAFIKTSCVRSHAINILIFKVILRHIKMQITYDVVPDKPPVCHLKETEKHVVTAAKIVNKCM